MFIQDLNSIRDRFKALSADLANTSKVGAPVIEATYHLGVDLDKAIQRRTTRAYEGSPDAELVKLLENTFACVEADDFAYHVLWRDHAIGAEEYGRAGTARYEWTNRRVTSVIVGQIEDMPVNVQLSFAEIGGEKVMFYHGCSQVVDHSMVRAFLDLVMPPSARRDGSDRLNNHDADHFGNVLNQIAKRNPVPA